MNERMTGRLLPGDPTTIGRWRILQRLGAGGMGVVYLAEREGLYSAMKVIHAAYAADPVFVARFRREVEAGRTVGGRYVAPVVDAEPDADPPWCATSYVPGPTLAAYVSEHGPLPADQAVSFAAGLLEGLAHIHASGIVHRDLKPSNVLVTAGGPVIIDLGVAAAADATSITGTGVAIGSAGWMAPEQVRGLPTGPATDVFAWGACVAFATTGLAPFGAGRADALAYRVAHEDPNISSVPPPLHDPVTAALAKDPSARPTVAQLGRAVAGATTSTAVLAAAWEVPTELAPALLPPTVTGTAVPTWPEAEANAPASGPPARRTRHRSVAAAAAVVAVAGAAAALWFMTDDPGDEVTALASSTTAAVPTTTSVPISTTASSVATVPPPTTAAPTTSPAPTAPPELSADLVGQTDTDPTHWRPSDFEAPQSLQVRVFDERWQLAYEFPVTMNGCATRQLRVAWRSLGNEVVPAQSYFKDWFDETPVAVEQVGEPAVEGTMLLNSCEQPAFSARPGESISDIVVDVEVWEPAAGG